MNAHIHRMNKDPAYRLNHDNVVPRQFVHQRGEMTWPGIYLELLHGRSNPAQDMEDWGFSCDECFGPIQSIIHTYNASTRLVFDKECRYELWLSDAIPNPEIITELKPNVLATFDDMLYYNGAYYGDWAFFFHEVHTP